MSLRNIQNTPLFKAERGQHLNLFYAFSFCNRWGKFGFHRHAQGSINPYTRPRIEKFHRSLILRLGDVLIAQREQAWQSAIADEAVLRFT